MPQRRITRRFVLASVGLLPLIAACGGDGFQYKISGDRAAEQRNAGGFRSMSAMTQEATLKLQEDYAKKAREAEAAQGAAGG